MIIREKKLELIFKNITRLNRFSSKMFLTFKIMNFENVVLTKVVHIYVIKAMQNAKYT
jgi:hypothetical protein